MFLRRPLIGATGLRLAWLLTVFSIDFCCRVVAEEEYPEVRSPLLAVLPAAVVVCDSRCHGLLEYRAEL